MSSRLAPNNLARLSVLLSLSLALYVVELQIPLVPLLPGLKLGLANIVTLFLLWHFPLRDVFIVLLVRVLLGSAFAGGVTALAFSLAGGILALVGSWALRVTYRRVPMVGVSIFGAMLHHTGQMAVALLMLGTGDVLYYYPFLLAVSILTGAVVGYMAHLVETKCTIYFSGRS